jgi:hypothetical protein
MESPHEENASRGVMKELSTKGKRNLGILIWMGLACQLAGVILAIAATTGMSNKDVLHGILFLTFGMALGGWAGNLREITDLKTRVADLEGRD